jgi:hypothetical protein
MRIPERRGGLEYSNNVVLFVYFYIELTLN